MKTKILTDFQICISVPENLYAVELDESEFFQLVDGRNDKNLTRKTCCE